MFVRPTPGLRVPDPILRDFLPAEGREVEPSDYWARRQRDGDVLTDPLPVPETSR